MTITRRSALGSAAAAAALSACAGREGTVELAMLYNKAARHRGPDRQPVIVIPGLLGTRLKDALTGKLVWGAFDGTAADPDRPAELRQIALPIGGGEPLIRLADDVVPAGVLDRARVALVGVPVELKVYAGILQTLGIGGYRDEALGRAGAIDYGNDHFTCFQYPYDWRRDIVDGARAIGTFIELRTRDLRREYATRFGIRDADIKFDIVAHSMGGLLLRYFLMYGDKELPEDGSLPPVTWAGAARVGKCVVVGTPHAGSIVALQNLVEGRRFAPFLPHYPSALLGTFPSLYQLMPRSRHKLVVLDGDEKRPAEDLYDPRLWQELRWGLAAPDQADTIRALLPDIPDAARRRERALRFQAQLLRRARQFMAAIDRPAAPPPGLKLHLVAGDGLKTPNRHSIDTRTGRLKMLDQTEGDGVVPRASALMDERVGQEWSPRLKSPIRFDGTLFLPYEHVEVTTNQAFRDNLLFWLLEEPREAPAAAPAKRRA